MVLATGQISLTDLNDTRQYMLYLNGAHKTQIFDPNAGTYTPDFSTTNLVITPELYVSGGTGENLIPSANVQSVKWYEGVNTTTALTEGSSLTTGDGLTYTIPTGTVGTTNKTLSLKSNLASMNNKAFTCVVVYVDPQTNFEVTIKALYEIVKITNGAAGTDGVDGEDGTNGINALTLLLSNEAVAIPTDQNGNNGNYANSGTNVYLYEGASQLAFDGVGTANGTFRVSASATGITAGAITDGGAHAVVANASAMTADTATITYTITGKRSNGTAISLTKTQSFSKAKTGAAPTTYWMVASQAAISKSEAGTYTPNSITASGMYQTGSGAPTAYSTYFRFSESTDGTNFTTKQTSSSNAASASYAFSAAGIKAIKVEMFSAGGTTTLLDSQIIPVVADGQSGSDGVDAYYLNLWAPNGDTIRNSNGTILLQADLYKGSGVVTPTAFKWYIQNPQAVGDSDSGAGWELLTSTNTHGTTGYTTSKLTVPATAIAGVEGFMCIATAPSVGTKYSGVIIVRDFQDPVIVNILGTSIFKNGVGTVNLTAQLIQAGAEISTDGYTFDWALYNSDGSLKRTYTATGPTLTVAASDVNGTANLVVDVTK